MSAFVSHTSALPTLIASHFHSYNIPSLLSAASPSPLSYSTSLLTPHSLLALSPHIHSHTPSLLPRSSITPHSHFYSLLTPHSHLSVTQPHSCLTPSPRSPCLHSHTQQYNPHAIKPYILHTFMQFHTLTHTQTCTLTQSYPYPFTHTLTLTPTPIHSHPHPFTHTLTPTHSHPQSLYTTQHSTCSGGGETCLSTLSHTADIHYNRSPIHTHLANHNSHWRRNHPLLQRMPTQWRLQWTVGDKNMTSTCSLCPWLGSCTHVEHHMQPPARQSCIPAISVAANYTPHADIYIVATSIHIYIK